MARVEKNAAGEDVPVNTPEFGCYVFTEEPKPAPATATATKTKPAAKAEAEEEGAE